LNTHVEALACSPTVAISGGGDAPAAAFTA
jgi:hypothetical protein